MALTGNAAYVTKDAVHLINVPMKTGATLYNGALLMFDTTSGGPVEPYDGTIGAILAGWHFGSAADDATSSPGYTAKISRGNFTIESLTVAGLANSTADIGKTVYATDDGTYTVTSNTTHQVAVGYVSRNRTSALADVTMVADLWGTVGV